MLVRFFVGLVFVSISSYLLIKAYLFFVPISLFPPAYYFYLPVGIMLGIASLLCTRLLMIYLLDLDVLRQRIAFIGDHNHASRLQQTIASDQSLGFEIVAVIDPSYGVAAQAADEALHGGVRGAELTGDLSVSRARDFGEEDGLEPLGAFEPVAGGEGL